MADNINVTQGTGTTIATDDIGGVQYQRVKLSQGADGSATDVSSAAPLQVTLANTGANATAVKVDGSAVTQPVSGTVTASAQPGVDIGDVTINNAAGASAVNIQDGGNSITVDGTVAATQSGTWTLGANSGVDIGDVTINNASGASAVNIQDGGNSITVDGTVAATQSGTWNVTNISGTVSLPTGAATSANQTTMITGIQLLDDAIVTDNGAFVDGTTKLNMSGFVFDETAGTALTENDAAAARVDSKRAQIAVLEDPTTRGRYATVTASNALRVDNSAVTQPVSGTITANAGTGTFAVSMATNTPVGNVAHDAVDSGAPIKTGGRARTSEITAVANDDRVDSVHDITGKQIILPYANPENFVSGAITTSMTGTTSTSLVAAPGVGLRNYITTIIVSNAHATVGTDIAIQDGSGGTTLMTIPAAAVYGGAVINLPVPLRQPTTNTALFCANVTTGASTKVSAVGYKGV